MTQPVFNPRVTELASILYSDLVRGTVTVADGAARMTIDPEQLARISFKLSAVFHGVLDELNAENLPKNVGFTPGVGDIASWTK